MSFELVAASVAITLALVFYTVGVFSERHAGSLELKHVVLFWCGLAFDTTGTTIMTNIAQTSGASGFGIHAISGLAAIVLMLVHAVWATATYLRKDERAEKTFHTFSTFVWLLWLVPYIIGLLVGIPAIHLRSVCAVGTSVIVVSRLRSSCSVAARSAAVARHCSFRHWHSVVFGRRFFFASKLLNDTKKITYIEITWYDVGGAFLGQRSRCDLRYACERSARATRMREM